MKLAKDDSNEEMKIMDYQMKLFVALFNIDGQQAHLHPKD
jgi:hypothetical protein